MLVQIYEVRSAAEAAAVAGVGVDHVGVLVGEGGFPRELTAAAAREVFAAVPEGVRRVALALTADLEEIVRVAAEARPDILHLGAAVELLSPVEGRTIRERLPGIRLMRSIPVVDEGSLGLAAAWRGVADFLLLDSHAPGDRQIGGLGRTHDWGLSRRIAASAGVPAILAGGLGPANVAAAIAAVGPAGVDSKTLTDRADGRGKDLDRVRAFVAAAKAARLTS